MSATQSTRRRSAEKYADEPSEIALDKCYAATVNSLPSVREFMRWLSQPAAQDWPAWCKVGAWAWSISLKMFVKIMCLSDGLDVRWFKPARVRPFTAKEAVDLAGKTIISSDTKAKRTVESITVSATSEPVLWMSGNSIASTSVIAITCTLEDGSPCGVLEVVETI